jgi:hypothetical protein
MVSPILVPPKLFFVLLRSSWPHNITVEKELQYRQISTENKGDAALLEPSLLRQNPSVAIWCHLVPSSVMQYPRVPRITKGFQGNACLFYG